MRHSRVAGPLPLLGRRGLRTDTGGMGRERVAATGGKRGKRGAEGPRPRLEGTIAPLWRGMVNPRWGKARGGSRAVGGVGGR